MSQALFPEEENKKNLTYQRFRASMHIGMGAIYLVLAVVLVSLTRTGGLQLNPPVLGYVIAGLMVLYGIFRIGRGIVQIRQTTSRTRP